MDPSESVYGLGLTPGLGYITGPEGQKAQKEALRVDACPARRIVISLVGRERQGKTSLRRLLSGEPFNENEPSTVGLERQLVDTQALDPGSASRRREWRPLELEKVNHEEFHEVLGHYIYQRLEQQRKQRPPTIRALGSFITLFKIGIISYLTLICFLTMSSYQELRDWPVLGLTLIGMFLACERVFGTRDGFGIAVGIVHLIVMCEFILRWRIDEWFVTFSSSEGKISTYLLSMAGCAFMEATVAIILGMSLGLGITVIYCMSRQPCTDYFQQCNPMLKFYLHSFVFGILLGIGLAHSQNIRRIVTPCIIALAIATLPPVEMFVFVCGLTISSVHGAFLALGRTFIYPQFICIIKTLTTDRLVQHMLRHCVGLLPGIAFSSFFGWQLVNISFVSSLAHILIVVILVAINEIMTFRSLSSPSEFHSPQSSSSSQFRRASKDQYLSFNKLSSSSQFRRASKDQCLSFNKLNSENKALTKDCNLSTQHPSLVLGSSSSLSQMPRFVVRDFAGHPLYYSAHHVYMAGQCIYLLVFSLVEVVQDYGAVLSSLVQWLQSIYLHTGFPDTRVFIVGTHRDHPKLKSCGMMNLVMNIGLKLRKDLPRHFHNMLAWNEHETPLFPVENSIRDRNDEDHKYLCNRLVKAAEELNIDKHPIRYFYFFHVLEERRACSIFLEKTDSLLSECQSNQCAIKDRNDFDKMLLFFQHMGEILYFPDDNLLQEFVVLGPHAVLAFLSKLLHVPKMSERHYELLMDWSRLQETGLCTRALFDHVLNQHAPELSSQSSTVIYLLQTLNLICPVGIKKANNYNVRNSYNENSFSSYRLKPVPCEHDENSKELYLVPAALPSELPYSHHYWKTRNGDWELFIDGLPVLPHPAYLRLLSLCVAQDACVALDDTGCLALTACQSRAAFTFGNWRCYKLEFVASGQEVGNYYHGRLLKLVIRGGSVGSNESVNRDENNDFGGNDNNMSFTSPSSSPYAVTDFVWRSLLEIVRRDFNRCHLRLGVRCPCPAPHQNIGADDQFHILSLCDTRSQTSHQSKVPDQKDFWCCGRQVVYKNGQIYEVPRHEDIAGAVFPNLPILETALCDLPVTLHAQICDLLDVPHALGNDWRALAGLLGKTVREVELLNWRAPRDPCDALLQDWASRAPYATVHDLVKLMHRIQRLDVVKLIEDFSL